MKIDLRDIIWWWGFLDKNTGEIVEELGNDSDFSRYFKLPKSEYSEKEENIKSIKTIENPHIRNFLLENYDDDFFFSRFLENNYDLGVEHTEYVDNKELAKLEQWAEENGIDYFISDDPM